MIDEVIEKSLVDVLSNSTPYGFIKNKPIYNEILLPFAIEMTKNVMHNEFKIDDETDMINNFKSYEQYYRKCFIQIYTMSFHSISCKNNMIPDCDDERFKYENEDMVCSTFLRTVVNVSEREIKDGNVIITSYKLTIPCFTSESAWIVAMIDLHKKIPGINELLHSIPAVQMRCKLYTLIKSQINMITLETSSNVSNFKVDYTLHLIKREIEYIFEYFPENYIDLVIRPKIKKDFNELIDDHRNELSLEGLSLIMGVFNETGFFCDDSSEEDILL